MQGLKARGNVKVEEAMFVNMRKLTRAAITDFEKKTREQWVLDHSSQVHTYLTQWIHQLIAIGQTTYSSSVVHLTQT
jgi:dynein heavy chain, axonemal